MRKGKQVSLLSPTPVLGYAHIFLRLCAFNGGTVIRGGPEYELPYFLSLLLTECDSVTPNSFERRRTGFVRVNLLEAGRANL